MLKQFSINQKKIASNVLWAVIGKVCRLLTEFVVGIFIARYLGPDKYGLMNYVISYVSIFAIIAEFGLSNVEIREMSKCNADINKILGTSFLLRLCFAIITYFIIMFTVFISNRNSDANVLILIYSLTIIFTSFDVIRNFFTSIIKNKYVVITGIVRNIIGAGVKVILLVLKAELYWFIIALVCDYIIIASGYVTSYKREIKKIKWYYDKKLALFLVKESFPLLLSGAAVIIYQRIDQVMIKNMIDNSSAGYFSVASRFAEFLLFIPIVISQTISPLLVKERTYDNGKYYASKRQLYLDFVTWTTIVMSVITSCSSYYLIKFTFGEQYMAAVPILQIIAFKAVFSSLANAVGNIIIIEGNQKWIVLKNLLGCFSCVLFNFMLIPKYGIVGSAWATIITMSITGLFAFFIIKPYRLYFYLELSTLLCGWSRILRYVVKNIFKLTSL